MKYKSQYIEALITLIEINRDKTWLQAFKALRTGSSLPGGGAGSLNDWGPSFVGKTEDSWYTELYNVLRFLFDNHLSSNELSNYKSVKLKDKIRIIRCTNCNKNYQHPSSFESHVALTFFKRNFSQLVIDNRLIDLIKPELSFQAKQAIDYRNWLKSEYERNDIKLYDFVASKYICPHCQKSHAETEHDLYTIKKNLLGKLKFTLTKQNAGWQDFE